MSVVAVEVVSNGCTDICYGTQNNYPENLPVVVVVVDDAVDVVCAANNQTNTYFYTFLRNKKDSYNKLRYSI